MARYTDLNEFNSERKTMDVVRERVANVILTALTEEFGEDFVRYIPVKIGITDNGGEVAKSTVVADVGTKTDKDGFDTGVCVEVITKVKKWNTTATKRGTVNAVTLDDYDIALSAIEDKGK